MEAKESWLGGGLQWRRHGCVDAEGVEGAWWFSAVGWGPCMVVRKFGWLLWWLFWGENVAVWWLFWGWKCGCLVAVLGGFLWLHGGCFEGENVAVWWLFLRWKRDCLVTVFEVKTWLFGGCLVRVGACMGAALNWMVPWWEARWWWGEATWR